MVPLLCQLAVIATSSTAPKSTRDRFGPIGALSDSIAKPKHFYFNEYLLRSNGDRVIRSTAVVRAQGESHARPRVLLHVGIKTESRNGAATARTVRNDGQQPARHYAARRVDLTRQSVPDAVSGR
jgi:hypothetical protein